MLWSPKFKQVVFRNTKINTYWSIFEGTRSINPGNLRLECNRSPESV